jgi:hypothetical protein
MLTGQKVAVMEGSIKKTILEQGKLLLEVL